ncbi:hypothetical protein RJ55_01933 [Drechmeria coniospora]|nr:hypothetical protein RJ55_01933 [Drechmeria coniospora]
MESPGNKGNPPAMAAAKVRKVTSSRFDDKKAQMSRSVLADVFSTNREPKVPPTPRSWSSRSQQQSIASEPSRDAFSAGNATGPQGTHSTPLEKHLAGKRVLTSHESQHRVGTPGSRQHTWGGAVHGRKAPADNRGQGHGKESTTWREITRSSKPKAVPHKNLKSDSAREPKADKSNLNTDKVLADNDFWGELESRVATIRDRRQSAAIGTTGKLASERHPNAPRVVQGNTPVGGDPTDDPARPRRKSRFEMEEEQKMVENKERRKPNKARRNRLSQEDHDWDDEALHRWEQRQRRQAEKEARKRQELEQQPAAVPISIPEYISAANLAQALKQRCDQFMKDMKEMGFENVTPDTIMTGDTAALIAMEYGFEPTVDNGSQRDLRPRPPPEDPSSVAVRPPIVTIMGHVDHGKTTILDWLRKSSIVAQEHGGITQHIGAFVVKLSSGKAITFLDTPGHAAFLSMRQRGANVTDIVVLVVAADDSVMPQTIEALKHATAAKVPIIVAINKIDKEDARVSQVKADLARHGVEIEDFGGDVQVVCVSSKTGQGMEDLEENIIALSEMLDVHAESDGLAEGWILESSVKQNGKTATVIVKRGTLRPGDFIVAGNSWARIRVLRNEAGVELSEAPPGTPVEIVGWRELPKAGEQVLQAPDEAKAKSTVEYRLEMCKREESSVQLAEQEQRQREKAAAEASQATAAADGADASPTDPAMPGLLYQNFSIKADVVGSVEAICGSILELGNNEVRPKILRSSAGQISESDVDHAAASSSVIINFNVAISPHIKQRAEEAKVKILDHSVIYHLIDDAKATLSGLLPDNISNRVTGEADILQVFPINLKKRVFKNIAGCRVRNGVMRRSSRVKVLRKGNVVFDGESEPPLLHPLSWQLIVDVTGRIDTLKHAKRDVMEMGKGTECGIGFDGFEDLQVDDQIQTYEEVKEKRTL